MTIPFTEDALVQQTAAEYLRDELGYYNMGLKQLAENIGLSMPKALAVVDELGLKGDVEFFKVIKIGKMVHKRYSKKALDVIREKLPNMNIDEVWSRNKP